MHRKCCIPGCNSSSKRKDVMHKMPAASEKLMLWHKTISAVPFTIFDGMTWVEIGKLYVCHKHFEAKYVSSKSTLKPNACPTLFAPEEIASGTPANTSAETGSMELQSMESSEHSYARKCRYDHTYAMRISANHAVPDSSHNITVADSAGAPVESTPPTDQGSNVVSLAVAGPSLEPNSVDSLPVLPADQASIAVAGLTIEETPTNPDPILASSVQAQNTKTEMQRSAKWVSRKRLVSNFGQLSPKCRELYLHYKKANKQQNYFRRAKMASKLSKEASFKQLVKERNSVARKFLWMQMKLCTRSKKGRRFSL